MAVSKSALRLLLEAQAKELGNLERQQQAVSLGLYTDARAALMERLGFLEGAAFGAAQFKRTELAIVATVGKLGRQFRLELGKMVRPATQLAKDHLGQQFAAFGGKLPTLPLQKTLDTVRSMVTPQAGSRVEAYAQALIRDMRSRLALSLMGKEDGNEARARLVKGYLAPLPENVLAEIGQAAEANVSSALGEALTPNMAAFGQKEPLSVASGLTEWAKQVPTTAYWAEKVVTDSVVRTTGTAGVLFLGDAAKEMPQLQKRWIAIIDARVCQACEDLDGDMVEINDVFSSDDFDDVMSPPLHPNCRCQVAAMDPTSEVEFDAVEPFEQ